MKTKIKLTPKASELDFYNKHTITFFNYNKLEQVPGYNEIFYYSSPMDSFMHTNGMVGMAATKVRFLLNSGSFITCDTILHDAAYDTLPEYVKQFLLAHEIGHIQNGDLKELSEESAKKLFIKRAFGLLPKMEIKADSYAASIVGLDTAKRALKFLFKNTDLPFNSKFELKRRYRKIRIQE